MRVPARRAESCGAAGPRTSTSHGVGARVGAGRPPLSCVLRISTGRLIVILSRLQRYVQSTPPSRTIYRLYSKTQNQKQNRNQSGAGGCAARRQTQNVLTRNTLEIGVNAYLDPTSPPKESASAVPVPVGLRALIHGFLITPTADADPRCQPYQKWSWGQPSPHGRHVAGTTG